MSSILSDKKNLKEKMDNVVEPFITNKEQTENTEKTKFMQDFENGETIEQSQNFVLKHIDELWKK